MTRAEDVVRKVVVPLKEVQEKIPRNKAGDPAFEELGDEPQCREDVKGDHSKCVLAVFTKAQVVAIVNRWLYQAEYQQTSHRERAAKIREREKPVKEAFKRLFPQTSFINATEEQIAEAVKAAYGEKEKGE